jgi:dTDP-4-amino-4,6-dideoxygalactose transaminase
VEPGEEIIVSPYTMCASATAPLVFNSVPIFADIEDEYFCLDPKSVEERITPRTRAIIVVDIFGLPYDVDAINSLAKKHGLYVIEDAAQAPGATYNGKFAGTLADIGVYSLNYHKHIHCGEGGIVVTDNDELADKVRLIRNHAEAVVEGKGVNDLTNMIGFNFRMPEMEAAITRCQVKKLAKLLEKRLENCRYLERRLAQFPSIILPKVRNSYTHSYYVHACKFKEDVAGISRDAFIEAVKAELPPFKLREAEGVKLSCGYVKPLYLQPLFQKKIVYGSKGFPFKFSGHQGSAVYSEGICPVVERMHKKQVFIHEFIQPQMSQEDLDDVVMAFDKVYNNIKELR